MSLSLCVLLVVGELRVSELYVQEQFINRFVLYFRIFSTATSTFDTADFRVLLSLLGLGHGHWIVLADYLLEVLLIFAYIASVVGQGK